MWPGQIGIDESAQPSRCSHKNGKACSRLDFIQLTVIEKGKTGRVCFHELYEMLSRRDGPLSERLCSRPEVDSVSVSAMFQQRRELRAEVWVSDPHGTSRPGIRGSRKRNNSRLEAISDEVVHC